MYADYNFYRTEYGGTLIDDEALYRRFSFGADALIDKLTHCRLHNGWPVTHAVKMAACAVAEEFFKDSQSSELAAVQSGIKSENTDGHAVTYADAAATEAARERRLCDAAGVYLPPCDPIRYAGCYGRGGRSC